MNQNMNPFLEELYNLEPELREQEEYIMKIIAQMNVLKPRPYISENFRKVLKNRLISEELLQKNQKIPPKKRRYKGLGYIFGAGMLASFAIGFGFLSVFDEVPKKNIALVTVQKEDTLSAKKEITIPTADLKKTLPKTEDRSTKIAMTLPKTEEKKASRMAPASTSTLSIETKIDTGTPLDVEIPVFSENQESFVPYVGENPTKEVSLNMQGRSTIGSDTMMKSSINIPPSEQTQTGISFTQIIEQAQKEADLLIPDNERNLYILGTPSISYISKESKTQKDTIEIVQIYTFPLSRVDGKESKVNEVTVIIN